MTSCTTFTRKNLFVKTLTANAILAFAGGLIYCAAAGAAEPDQQDKSFMVAAAEAGNAEIAASKIAQSKAISGTVKTFAATMVADHANVAAELKALASKKGVTLPDQPDKQQQAEIAKLNTIAGAKFDAEYAKQIGVAAHKDAVALFSKASKNAVDPEIKAFAAKTLPALEHHLEMAQSVHAAVGK